MEQINKKSSGEGSFLSFDIIVIIQDVLKKWLLIVLAALVVGVGTYIKVSRDYSPIYQTTTTFVVTTRGASTTVYSNLSSTSSLASVFTELLKSSILRKNILSEIGAASFNGSIDASVVAETNLITVRVRASNPREAFLVAEAIINHHEELTYQIVDSVSLEVLGKPTVPMSPINFSSAKSQATKMMMYTAVGVAVILAVMSYFKDTVRSGKEAKEKLDCRYLGEIPHEEKYKTLSSRIHRKKKSILITNPVTSFKFVETIRKLRHRTEQLMNGKKVLMVTSLLENEGKSTVSVNLALSLAQKHNKVLLIDCDLRKPACYAILEQKKFTNGLRSVLLDEANLSEALIRERKTGMYLLLERKADKNSGDLISSEKMQALLRWARKEFDYVILDLPPMAEVSDAESMTEFADAVLLVVRQNAAMAPAINKAAASLENSKAKLLGCVLNNVYKMPFVESSGYGYGYGGYGKYGHYGHYGNYASKRNNK